MAAILGALPLWKVRLTGQPPPVGGRHMLFFPGKAALELRAASPTSALSDPLWSQAVQLGSDTIATDLDGDGLNEIISAYPRDAARSRSLLFVDTPEASSLKRAE